MVDLTSLAQIEVEAVHMGLITISPSVTPSAGVGLVTVTVTVQALLNSIANINLATF